MANITKTEIELERHFEIEAFKKIIQTAKINGLTLESPDAKTKHIYNGKVDIRDLKELTIKRLSDDEIAEKLSNPQNLDNV